MAYGFKHFPQGSNVGNGAIRFKHYGKEVGTCTVTFIAKGNTVSKVFVKEGNKIALSDIPANPTRSGWSFEGWYINENTRFSVETVITKDLTVTAKWEQTTQIGTELQTCKDCGGDHQIETMCPICNGTGFITNACNSCGVDLGDDWSIDIQPNCAKCGADLSRVGAINPNVKCYGACDGEGTIYDECTCDNGQREYPVYETIRILY